MKKFLILLCLAISILSAYGVEAEKMEYSRSWSLADPLVAVLGITCLVMFGMGTWMVDRTAFFQLGIAATLGVSAMANAAWRNGTLLNSGRMACTCALLYFAMSNVVRSMRDLRRFSGYCLIAGAVVYAVSIPTFLTTWSGGFTNNFLVFGLENLNDFGFLFVVIFCASAPVWLRDRNVTRGFLIAAGLASGALVSLSRSAWTTLAIVTVICSSVRDSKSRRGHVVRLATLGLGLIAAAYVFSLVVARLPEAQQFGETKLEGYGEDAVDTRLVDLTLTPLAEWLQQPVPVLIFGDATSDHHTFLANSLWSTGIFGLFFSMAMYISMFLAGVRCWRLRSDRLREYRLAGACYAALTIVFFLDDCATNMRYHSLVVTYLFFTSAGAFAGSLKGVNRARPNRAAIVHELVGDVHAVSA